VAGGRGRELFGAGFLWSLPGRRQRVGALSTGALGGIFAWRFDRADGVRGGAGAWRWDSEQPDGGHKGAGCAEVEGQLGGGADQGLAGRETVVCSGRVGDGFWGGIAGPDVDGFDAVVARSAVATVGFDRS